MLIGFLHRGGLSHWSYAVGADIIANDSDFIRFTNDDIDFKTRTILGEIWKNGNWVRKRTLFPIAIKNFELNKGKDRILNNIPYSLGEVIRKDDQMRLFSNIASISTYIPKSFNVKKGFSIIDKIRSWGIGLLKPSTGRLGQGIILLKVNGSNFDINDNGDIKTVTKEELVEYLEQFYQPDSRDYILQQFAAGTGPNGRYFNIRVIVTKSFDGDWHACNSLMALLAKDGSIIANRDVGAKNIDLDSWLRYKYKNKLDDIYNEFFATAINITRVLDDATNATAEEIALDMAIDNNGKIWLHEANWRGGMWLFYEDIGLYRHSGGNLKRLAIKDRTGDNVDKIKSLNVAVKSRKDMMEYSKKIKNCKLEDGILFGLVISHRTDESTSIVTKAITYGVPIIAVSSLTSFLAAQQKIGEAIKIIDEQVPNAILPFIISKGGACVYNPKSGKGYQSWINDELLNSGYIDMQDFESGYSL